MFEQRPWLWRALLLGGLLSAFLFQGSRGLYSPDEGRYTAVAVEMLESGDWLHPRLHPEAPHYTKPPLTYWAIAGSVGLFGYSEFAVRLPGALAFALTCWLVFGIALVLDRGRAKVAALIYATFLMPVLASNVVSTDTLLALMSALYAFGFVRARVSPSGTRALKVNLAIMWTGVGLAFLTKGPPGLLPLLGLLVFAWSERAERPMSHYFSILGFALFLLIGLGWYARMVLDEPALLKYFLIDETVHRVASGAHRRNAQWYGAFLVYLPTLLLGTLPWGLLLAAPLWAAVRKPGPALKNLRVQPSARLLACWIGIPLLVFMLAQSRLPLYVLPLFVPLALACAHCWRWPTRIWLTSIALTLMLAMLGIRAWAAQVQHLQDDRALAAGFAKLMPDWPDEILFSDTAPRYGLRLYLDIPIERVNTGRDSTPRLNAESLLEELASDQGCQVFVTLDKDASMLKEDLHSAGVPFKLIGHFAGYQLIALERKCHPRQRLASR